MCPRKRHSHSLVTKIRAIRSRRDAGEFPFPIPSGRSCLKATSAASDRGASGGETPLFFQAEHAPEEAKAPDGVHPLQDLVAVWELRKVSQFHLLSGALVCNFCQSFGCLSLQVHELTVRVAPEQPLAQKSCTGSHRWWASPYNLLISKEKIAHLVRNTSCARERLFTLIASGGGSHHFGDCHETRIPRP